MNEVTTPKKESRLVLHRETLRRLADPRSVYLGPETSCIDPCCVETVELQTA